MLNKFIGTIHPDKHCCGAFDSDFEGHKFEPLEDDDFMGVVFARFGTNTVTALCDCQHMHHVRFNCAICGRHHCHHRCSNRCSRQCW